MSFLNNIIYSIDKRLERYRSMRRWSRYGDETCHHFSNPNFKIGRYTYGIPEVTVYDLGTHLTIGKFCSIAKDVRILLGGEHDIYCASSYPFSRYPETFDKLPKEQPHNNDVTIGNDVWIGRGALILSGVTIGDGAIIGAGAVVSKDIPPYAVAVGNPIRVIKYRLTPEQISDMLTIGWWDLPEEKINSLLPYMYNVKDFISACYSQVGGVLLRS